MQLPKSKPSKDFKRELAKKGKHNVRLAVIADLGMVEPNDPKFKARRMMMWLWERVDESKKGAVKYTQQRVPFSDKSKVLKQMLTDWLDYSPRDFKKFEIQDLLGEAAVINIVHNNGYANVKSVEAPTRKVGRGLMKHLCVVLDPEEYNAEAFEELPEWVQNLMIESEEFQIASGEKPASKKKRGDDDDDKPRKRRGGR